MRDDLLSAGSAEDVVQCLRRFPIADAEQVADYARRIAHNDASLFLQYRAMQRVKQVGEGRECRGRV